MRLMLQEESTLHLMLAQFILFLLLDFGNDCATQVRSAFRQLALLVHPDKNNDPRAGEAFAKLQKVMMIMVIIMMIMVIILTASH